MARTKKGWKNENTWQSKVAGKGGKFQRQGKDFGCQEVLQRGGRNTFGSKLVVVCDKEEMTRNHNANLLVKQNGKSTTKRKNLRRKVTFPGGQKRGARAFIG